MRGKIDRTMAGLAMIAIGIVLVAISALGDQLGGEKGFGWKQTLGVTVGGAAVLLGLVVVAVRSRREP